MRIGSLFSGIGGLELGLEWAGVGHTVWQVEQDSFCRAVLARHWPDAQRYNDVREVGAQNLEPVDLICGGFPCQDISYAGKGAGLAGARSGLWYEFARIVGELGPRFVVVENVAALFTRGIDAVLGTLADLGYDAEWSTLRASDVGAPHQRKRVFIIAAMGDTAGRGWRAGAGIDVRRVGGGCEGMGDSECVREPQPEGSVADQRGRVGDGSAGVGDAHGERGRGRGEYGHARDVNTPGKVVGWRDAVPVRGHDGTVRLIPREAAVAGPQSPLWPVAHGVPGRVARLRAIGNAVVPQCAEVVGRRLLAMMEAA